MGSDWAVSSPNPVWEMHVAVERRAPASYAGDQDVFLPEERLDLVDALAGFTCNAAYVNHLDAETGTIEVGKLADLAVLDRDLFDRGGGSIGDARVVGTFVEGVAVFEDPDLGG
jgi:predicted amidohydrolase YtcJ